MKIFLHEISDHDTELSFNQEEKWVRQAVSLVDEKSEDERRSDLIETHIESKKKDREPTRTMSLKALSQRPLSQVKDPKKDPKQRPIEASFNLRKVDEVVVISGKIKTQIQLICSRCATPYLMKCEPSISSLYCKDPVMAGVAHLQRAQDADRDDPGRPAGQNKGFARHAHDYQSDEAVDSGQDLDINYIAEDSINLADVLTEQLQLQVPFQPLCREDCKGMCFQCGADLNVGRCACSKLGTNNPFSRLKDLKGLK